jgi:hypothetical protein
VVINVKKVIRKRKNIQLELEDNQFTIRKDNESDTWNLNDNLFRTVIASALFGKVFNSMMEERDLHDKNC